MSRFASAFCMTVTLFAILPWLVMSHLGDSASRPKVADNFFDRAVITVPLGIVWCLTLAVACFIVDLALSSGGGWIATAFLASMAFLIPELIIIGAVMNASRTGNLSAAPSARKEQIRQVTDA